MPEENQNVEEFQTTEEIHTTNESTQSHMEVETQEKKKNTVGAVGMRFSIIGLIALIAPLTTPHISPITSAQIFATLEAFFISFKDVLAPFAFLVDLLQSIR